MILLNLLKRTELFLISSWWVFLFIFGCYLFYSTLIFKSNSDFKELNIQICKLKEERQYELELQEDLLLQINSQNDPKWIEIVLMKNLGVVPKGKTKVYFE